MTIKKAPCGTSAARRRHRRHNETCHTCTPQGHKLQPCGTTAAYQRHRKAGEHPCDPCRDAYLIYYRARTRPKKPRGGSIEDLITEAEHLTGLGQGTDYILRAIGYAGRERQLRDRLQKHGRLDLYHRTVSEEYWAAA